mgnify:CR=1 FL=1
MGKETILIVEDNFYNICAIESLFNQLGHQCDISLNGNEAIKAVTKRLESKDHRSMYKLILLDFSMPECNGPNAAQTIRQLLTI